MHVCLFLSGIEEKEKASALDSFASSQTENDENKLGKDLHLEWLDLDRSLRMKLS